MRHYPACIIAGIIAITCFYSCDQPAKKGEAFIDIAGLDSTISPGDNFFSYVNGKWDKTIVIPATEAGAGSFFDLQVRSDKALKEVCEEAAADKNAKTGSVEQMVGDLYTSVMDTVAVEEKGFEPLNEIFTKISLLKDSKEIMRLVAREKVNGNNMLFGFNVGTDDKNATMNIAVFNQAGLGLPDRDYYFRNDSGTHAVRSAYTRYLEKIFLLTGDDSATAKKNAQTVVRVETKLAAGHFTNVELRDPDKNYNKLSLQDLSKLTPAINWHVMMQDLLLKTDTVLINQLKFFTTVNGLLQSIPVEQWKPYLKAATISNSAQSLNQALSAAHFEFYGKTLLGQQEPKPRWQYAVTVMDGRIGDLVGQLYVKKNFDERARKKMMEMIDNLQTAYEKRIIALDWMSDPTKQRAIAKLNSIARKIGFPGKWKTYDTLRIVSDNYFQNRISTSRYEYYRNVAKNGKAVDKSEWYYTPPTVNAYYNGTNNEIMFLAGILQPPFFYPEADDAVNYGGIGMVIGHEFTHGFDDQGRKYDKDGNLKDWWTKADAEKFTEKTKQVGKQYSQYIPIDSLPINADLTMGENLADIGGLAIAYDAFKMTQQGRGSDKIDGLTPDQRFFISFASIWRIKMKDELMRQIVLTDVHSPAAFRVNGSLSNLSPFYEAFNVKEGSKMWKPEKDRIKIW